ncbi:hypothetical protein HKCCE4037_01955 [Rhodobacterales bacterium HKCCE4037]|nr:hypothetical protein [Rhodobacterales bacterium HKCCE4037]
MKVTYSSHLRVADTPNRRAVFRAALILLLVSVGLPGNAQAVRPPGVIVTVEELPGNRYLDVVRTLGEQGYQIISVSRTLLNRIRIQAANDVHLREIVFSQSSGLIMRDVIIEEFGGGRTPP